MDQGGLGTVINPCQMPRGDIFGAVAKSRHGCGGGLQGGGDLNLAFAGRGELMECGDQEIQPRV